MKDFISEFLKKVVIAVFVVVIVALVLQLEQLIEGLYQEYFLVVLSRNSIFLTKSKEVRTND